jgi:hypothetical protein
MRATLPLLLAGLVMLSAGCQSRQKPAAAAQHWSGTWKAQGVDYGGPLQCVATPLDDTRWRATFTGFGGRDFLYEIAMHGQREGDRIVFAGEVDLGDKDGGVFTWTGAIDGDTFSGEYTSKKGARGTFTMTRR